MEGDLGNAFPTFFMIPLYYYIGQYHSPKIPPKLKLKEKTLTLELLFSILASSI